MENLTYSQRLAAQLDTAPALELFPYGKPARACAWSNVASRGHTAAAAPIAYNVQTKAGE